MFPYHPPPPPSPANSELSSSMEPITTPQSTPSGEQGEPFLQRPEAVVTKTPRKPFMADIDIAKTREAAPEQLTPSKVTQCLSLASGDTFEASSSSKIEQQRVTSAGSQPLASPETPFLRFLPKWDEPDTATNNDASASARRSAEALGLLADIAANLTIGTNLDVPGPSALNDDLHHRYDYPPPQEDKPTQTDNDTDSTNDYCIPSIVIPSTKEEAEASLIADLQEVRKWAKKLIRARVELDEHIEDGTYSVEVLIGNSSGDLQMVDGKGWPSARSSYSRIANTQEQPEIKAARRLPRALKALRYKHKKLMEDDSDFEDNATVFDNNDYLDAIAFYNRKRAELVKMKAKAVKSGIMDLLKVRREPLHNNLFCVVKEEFRALYVVADWHVQLHPTREAKALKYKLENGWLESGENQPQSAFEMFCRYWGEDYESVLDVDENIFRGVDLPQLQGPLRERG